MSGRGYRKDNRETLHHGEYTVFAVMVDGVKTRKTGRTAKLLHGRYYLWWGKVERPTGRGSWRTPPLWMTINRLWGRCWCGRTKSGDDRKFCRENDHYTIWSCYIRTQWGLYSSERVRAGVPCDRCGREQKPWGRREPWKGHQVDHIIALKDGGEMWANWNHQILCTDCHKTKTAAEAGARAELRARKRAAKRKAETLGGGPDLGAYLSGKNDG